MKFLVFGEIIWDLYPDKRSIGGAPFNFAAYTAAAGTETYLISGVGQDALGDSALKCAADYGIRADYILPNSHPTGSCWVTLNESGMPSYALAENTAYDYVTVGHNVTEKLFDLFYFGTLAQRSPGNVAGIRKILEAGNCREIFCDLNLRPPLYTEESVRLCLSHATILKISREELAEAARLGLGAAPWDPETAAERLAAAYPGIKVIVITLDRDGAMAYDTRTKRVCYRSAEKAVVVSTVGAGDSFSAAFAVNWLRGASIEKALDAGVHLSAKVVASTEAIVWPVPNFA